MGIVDKVNFEELQVSEEVVNMLKNSMTSFLDKVSIWVTNFLTSMLTMISSVATVGVYTVVTILATYFICADRIYILDQIEHHFPKEWVKKFSKNVKKITKMLGGYLKAQGILIGINFVLVLIRINCV
ncbi:MAG: AI-2E family transporter [Clostridia bacterium]|jgi:predicted PurR-regulated permease PerM|nr:AI-2E family transporter [Clostridia bacterium]